MKDQTLLLKGIGTLLLIVGILGLLWGTTSLLGGVFKLPALALAGPASGPWLILPWTQLTVISCACLYLVAGWGLLARQRWVQTVMVPAHLLFVVYSAVLWIIALAQGRPAAASPGMSALFAALILVNGGMALFMNSTGTTEALSWLPLRTTPLVPLRCEFCGTPLDPRTNRCPECEAVPEVIAQRAALLPPEAVLISLTDDTRFEIKPGGTAIVGRGSQQNAVNLSNPTVSRHHAQIVYEQERYVLIALQDLNGTFVNDSLVRKRALQDGDEVRFGRARFRFKLMELDGSVRD